MTEFAVVNNYYLKDITLKQKLTLLTNYYVIVNMLLLLDLLFIL